MSNSTPLFIMLGVICALFVIGMPIYVSIMGYQYELKIGSYMDNAVDMVAPEGMLEQIQLAKQAMIDEGLTEDLYGAWIFKKPSNSMKFQYQHLDAISERIQAVIDWKEKVYSAESTSSETLGDVYEQKMSNLRAYVAGNAGSDSVVVGGRSDWIAKDVWWLRHHFVLQVFGVAIWSLLLLMTFLFFGLAAWSVDQF